MLSVVKKYPVCLLFIFSLVTTSFTQTASLERDYQPIVIQGSSVPDFEGVSVAELFLFCFNDTEQKWQMIPFQIDEKGMQDSTLSYFFEDDGLFDADDELVFLARDAWQQSDTWIDDANSKTRKRYEIELTNPTNQNKAWVYLYQSNTLSLDDNLTDYVEYVPPGAAGQGDDGVKSKYYHLFNGENGFPDDLLITHTGGGDSTHVLDRLKIRASASLLITLTLNENDFMFRSDRSDSVRFKDGLVRVIRENRVTLFKSIFGLTIEETFIPKFIYYPYSSSVIFEIPEIATGISISSGRLSLDLEASVADKNTKIVSANNPEPGFDVDGAPEGEAFADSVDNLLPDNNWVFIGGTFGTLVHLFPLDKNIGNERKLYYADTMSNVGDDTGDKESYGDTGILVSGGIEPPAILSYTGYYLGSDKTSAVASKIAEWERTPIVMSAFSQTIDTVPVQLAFFKADVDKNTVHLHWQTVQAIHHAGFEIERSPAGQKAWLKIAFIAAAESAVSDYEFVDKNLQLGRYDYRLKQIDSDGRFEFAGTVTAFIGAPESYFLSQNFPNPFNPETTIQYQIPGTTQNNSTTNKISLIIYNLLGQEIRTLVDGEHDPGFYSVTWDAKDNAGRGVATGVYLYRLHSGNFVSTKKLVLVK